MFTEKIEQLNRDENPEKEIHEIILDFNIVVGEVDENDLNELSQQVKVEHKEDFLEMSEDEKIKAAAINKMSEEDVKKLIKICFDGESKHLLNSHDLLSLLQSLNFLIDKSTNSKFSNLMDYISISKEERKVA